VMATPPPNVTFRRDLMWLSELPQKLCIALSRVDNDDTHGRRFPSWRRCVMKFPPSNPEFRLLTGAVSRGVGGPLHAKMWRGACLIWYGSSVWRLGA
jgi:hypothetical protein